MKTTLALPAMVLALGLVGVPAALAGPVSIYFTTPTNSQGKDVTISIGKTELTVRIPAGTSAEGKRDLIKKAIEENGVPKFTVADTKITEKHPDPGIEIKHLTKGTVVKFNPGETGEAKDEVTALAAVGGSFGFDGLFAAADAFGMPSFFTGGLITDVGELSFSIPATSLAALDGYSITQALFALLNPAAAGFGASIVNGGNVLHFAFDPAVTMGGAGVVFGTTALSEGAFGSVIAGAEVPEPATLVLLGTGLLGFARGFRKRLMRAELT